MDLQLNQQPAGQLGERFGIFARVGLLAKLLADQQFVVEQFEDGLGVITKRRELTGVRRDFHRLARIPAPALVDPEH